ncbi:serine protease [Aureococcus anophagefferens]|nr:serine protease [Aureococcus anophagefferens]
MHAVAAARVRAAPRGGSRDAADQRRVKVRVAGHVEDDDALAAAPAPARPDETPFKVQQLRRESLAQSLEDQALGLMLRPLRATYDVGDLGPARFDFLGKSIARRDFVVVNGRGQRLRASRWAADDAPPAAPTVLCLHGNQSSRVEGLHYLALVLELGCALVAVDCAGSGKSDGDKVSLGLREAADASDVVDALYATHGTPPEKIVVWGRSMGASAALLCAADHQPGLAGLILDSPFASLVKLVNDLTKHAARSRANPDGKSTFASLVDGAADDRAAAVDAPGGVLLIAGDRGAIVPPKRNAAPILAALDARPGRAGDATLVRCERAGHDGCRPLAVYRAARRHLANALALDASAADLADLITVAPAPDDAPRHVYLAVPWQIHAALEKKRLAQTSHAAPGPVPDRRESADHLLAEISRIQRELESIQGGEA